jgi:hypothetical protein
MDFFARLDSADRYAGLYRAYTAKKPETRAQRIERLVASWWWASNRESLRLDQIPLGLLKTTTWLRASCCVGGRRNRHP